VVRPASDLPRISDARMSGTSYGAVVLHVAPEAAVGGPLAPVRTGDRIRLALASRTLDVLVDEHVLQASYGCDLDFLRGTSGAVTEHETYL
jgi:dihydroxy-acid dehydratase